MYINGSKNNDKNGCFMYAICRVSDLGVQYVRDTSGCIHFPVMFLSPQYFFHAQKLILLVVGTEKKTVAACILVHIKVNVICSENLVLWRGILADFSDVYLRYYMYYGRFSTHFVFGIVIFTDILHCHLPET